MRNMALIALTLPLLACEGGLTVAEEPEVDELRAAATPTLPPVQEFRMWDGRTPFWRPTSEAITVIVGDPDDARKFRAYGVDTANNLFQFQVRGNKVGDAPRFYEEIATEMGDLVPGLWTIVGNAKCCKGPNPNPPGTPGFARKLMAYSRQHVAKTESTFQK